MKLRRPRLPILGALVSSIACATAPSKAPRAAEPDGASALHDLSPADAAALHHLLARFDADESPLDPRLAERVAYYVAQLRQQDLPAIAQRRVAVWPAIRRALDEKKLPEALGAIACRVPLRSRRQ